MTSRSEEFGLLQFLIKFDLGSESLIEGLTHDDQFPFPIAGDKDRFSFMTKIDDLIGLISQIGDGYNSRHIIILITYFNDIFKQLFSNL